jgi:hypothetical protein
MALLSEMMQDDSRKGFVLLGLHSLSDQRQAKWKRPSGILLSESDGYRRFAPMGVTEASLPG